MIESENNLHELHSLSVFQTNMTSSIPSRINGYDSNQSDSRRRLPSPSNMSRTPLAAVRQSNSQRSRARKAKQKSVSNRSRHYVASASPHSNRTTTSIDLPLMQAQIPCLLDQINLLTFDMHSSAHQKR